MTLEPILTASLEIQIHVASALLALLIGPISIWRKRKDRLHKALGVVWIASMLVLATTGLMIHEIRMIGPFSPIHLFSFLTFWSLWQAIAHLRAGRYAAHGMAMKSLYLTALALAGFFTLMPGRRMNDVIFGAYGNLGFTLLVVIAMSALVWRIMAHRRTALD